jgi:hypothetical protein
VEKVVRVFASFEEADEADRQAYERMSPQQRIEMLLTLHRMMVKEGDESAERLESGRSAAASQNLNAAGRCRWEERQ